MKIIYGMLMVLCPVLSFGLNSNDVRLGVKSRPFSVFDELKRQSGGGIFSQESLKGFAAETTVVDGLNNVVCVISEDRTMVFFIYTKGFGYSKYPMKSERGVYISIGTAMSGDRTPDYVVLRSDAQRIGQSSFIVRDRRAKLDRRVSFLLEDGREKFIWVKP